MWPSALNEMFFRWWLSLALMVSCDGEIRIMVERGISGPGGGGSGADWCPWDVGRRMKRAEAWKSGDNQPKGKQKRGKMCLLVRRNRSLLNGCESCLIPGAVLFAASAIRSG